MSKTIQLLFTSDSRVSPCDKKCKPDSDADRQIPAPNHDLILGNLSPTNLCARAINLELPPHSTLQLIIVDRALTVCLWVSIVFFSCERHICRGFGLFDR